MTLDELKQLVQIAKKNIYPRNKFDSFTSYRLMLLNSR
jgi:hypothetical protein